MAEWSHLLRLRYSDRRPAPSHLALIYPMIGGQLIGGQKHDAQDMWPFASKTWDTQRTRNDRKVQRTGTVWFKEHPPQGWSNVACDHQKACCDHRYPFEGILLGLEPRGATGAGDTCTGIHWCQGHDWGHGGALQCGHQDPKAVSQRRAFRVRSTSLAGRPRQAEARIGLADLVGARIGPTRP